MSSSRIHHFFRLLALLLPLVAPAARAAEVRGTVTDYSDDKPLDGVRVYIISSDGKTVVRGPVGTVNGVYKFDKVDVGTYILRFDLTGYTPRPDDYALPIQNSTDAKPVDTALMKEAADTAYYVKAGARFANLVKLDGGKTGDYQRRWEQLRRIGPAPAAKIEIIRGLANTDKKAGEQLPLDQYLKLAPKDLEKIAEPFNKVLTSDTKMPKKDFAEVGEEVLADVVLHELRKSKAEPKAKNEFVEQFAKEWKGSKAADIVTASYKSERMKLINPK